MERQELLNELKYLKDDLKNKRLSFEEILNSLYILESVCIIPFSVLYNGFLSSKPELYINQYF